MTRKLLAIFAVLALAFVLQGDWGSEITCTQDDAVDGTGWDDITCPATFTAEDHELIDLWVRVDNESGSVTDSLTVQIVTSPDGGTDYSLNAVFGPVTFTPATVNQEWYHCFFISSVEQPKIQVQATGSTDEYTVDFSYLKLTYDGSP